MFWRFNGRGSPGDDERGSKAGSKDGAARFVPVVEEEDDVLEAGAGKAASWLVAASTARVGDELIMILFFFLLFFPPFFFKFQKRCLLGNKCRGRQDHSGIICG